MKMKDDSLASKIEILPPANPAKELNEALAAAKQAANVIAEEKKSEEPAEEFDGEGQEALWVDEEGTEEPSPRTESPPPTTTTNKRSGFFKKSKTAAAVVPKPTRKKKEKNKVLLLPSEQQREAPTAAATSTKEIVAEEEKKEPSAVDMDPAIQKEAGMKVVAARRLLDQALLSPNSKVGSPEFLAQSAFREAAGARKLVDGESQELDAVLLDATEKGAAAVSEARKAPSMGGDSLSNGENISNPPLKVVDADCEHAARARQYLESILPDIPNLPQIASTDEISTLGFDNTFEVRSKESKDNMDILSMSSLNEILDGPMEEDSPVKHRIQPEPEPEEEEKPKKKGFGSIFRRESNAKKAASAAARSVQPEAVEEGSKKVEPKQLKSAERQIKRFVATVLVDDGGRKQVERETSNVKGLKKYQDVDQRLEETLMEALASDETESLTSHEGVKLFGKQETKDKKEKQKERAIEKEVPKGKPRDFSATQPQFITAPQGEAAILTQKSWDSLLEEGAVDLRDAPVVKPKLDDGSVEESAASSVHSAANEEEPGEKETEVKAIPSPDSTEPETEVEPISSASPVSSTGIETSADKYTVVADPAAAEDKYTVLDNTSGSAYEACLGSCCGSGLTFFDDDDDDDDDGMHAKGLTRDITLEAAAIEIDEKEKDLETAEDAEAEAESKKDRRKSIGFRRLFGRKKGQSEKPESEARALPTTAGEPTPEQEAANVEPEKAEVPVAEEKVEAPVALEKAEAPVAEEEEEERYAVAPPVAPETTPPAPLKKKTTPTPAVELTWQNDEEDLKVTSRNEQPTVKKSGSKKKFALFRRRSSAKKQQQATPPRSNRSKQKERSGSAAESAVMTPLMSGKWHEKSDEVVPEEKEEASSEVPEDKARESGPVDLDEELPEDKDPLLYKILEQKNRPRKGMDPTTVRNNEEQRRGIDP